MSVPKLFPAFSVASTPLLFGLVAAFAVTGCSTTPKTSAEYHAADISAERVPEQMKPDLYPQGAKAAPEPVVRYGRYTLVSTDPKADQQDLLSQIVDVTVPDSLNPSVHDAMSYVLKRSGYGLCSGSGDVKILYTRPLPASQYHLGPMTLRNTVQVLAGPAWQVEVDEVSRSICFVQRPGYKRPSSASMVAPATHQVANPAAVSVPQSTAAPVNKGPSL
ncbi:PilL N-terminal domain-containing protein [Pseudomonas ficuserectae]|uniref:PFGI-1 class ICE element type IV pilus protein PilL2 n=1 Tax=Pseudomonas ficuserectae TaxID=53410 RepID=UPI0006D632A9|nr:hypothetical protein ALO69_200037 [Pseudomonas ficuserectae]RMS37763.1 hypothetical protein ALP68_200021 [Pseudomonas ficuserectae]RMS43398.1 Type IV pilus bioproteinsis protein PilL [Pseudomonas ficuserectae]